jgi:hypothetical protein
MTEDLNNSSAKSVTSYSSSQQNTPVSTQSKALNVSAHHHKIPPAPNLSPMAGSIHPSQTAHQGTLHSSSSVASSNTSPLPSPSFAKDSNHHSTTVSVFHPVSTTATTITSSSPSPPPPTTKKHYSHDESSTSANAVLLGIETLERQQEELERKRRISTQKTPTPPVVERHNPFDDGIASESKQTKDRSHLLDTPQTVFMGNTFHTSSHPPPPQQQQNQPSRQRMIPHQPQDHQMELDHHVPRTVQRGGSEIDDEITMESDLPLTHHQQQQQTQSKSGSLPLHKRSSHSRNASFGSFASKFFKTPMVSVCFVLCLCRGDHLVRRDTDTFHIPSLSLSLFSISPCTYMDAFNRNHSNASCPMISVMTLLHKHPHILQQLYNPFSSDICINSVVTENGKRDGLNPMECPYGTSSPLPEIKSLQLWIYFAWGPSNWIIPMTMVVLLPLMWQVDLIIYVLIRKKEQEIGLLR